jgi:hypothetical protein
MNMSSLVRYVCLSLMMVLGGTATVQAAAPPQNKLFRVDAVHPLPDGWHRARSTEGKFSIDLPGPFTDATIVKDGHSTYFLKARDRYGSIFMAVVEHAGPGSSLAGTFNEATAAPGATTVTFRGVPMVATRAALPESTHGMIGHAYLFKAKGGTCLLVIASAREHEAASLRQMDRFLNSLQFE